MSTPVSLDQVVKFLRDVLGSPSRDKMQHFLANGAFFKELAQADFSKIDRAAFTASLTPTVAPTAAPTAAPIAWRPVSEYADKINEWNELRGWGLTKTQITTFAENLVDHLDPLHPTGISLWLGRDLPYNWEEVMACLEHEVTALGEKFTRYVGTERVSFFPRSEQTGGRKLAPALLDLQTYWDSIDGVVPDEVRKIEERLPGLEVAWLLALNPQVYVAIDHETTPGLIAAGLVFSPDLAPYFGCNSSEVFVRSHWSDVDWNGSTVVCFREC